MTENPQDPQEAPDSSRSLWLVVRRGGKITSYEFPPDTDRTVVAGASDRAQIHISRSAPIAFYIERVEKHLCITSCYPGAKLCVNARIMRGRQWITEPSQIEVAGESLELFVRESPPAVPRRGDAVSPVCALDGSPARRPRLPTLVGMGRFGVSPASQDPSLTSCERAAPPEQPPAEASGESEPAPSSDLSSVDTPDVFLAAFDDWFDATLLGDVPREASRPRPLEPSWQRGVTPPLKLVPARLRPLGSVSGTDPDCARTLEFAAVRVTSLTEGLKTLELKAPSAGTNTASRRDTLPLPSCSSPTTYRKPPELPRRRLRSVLPVASINVPPNPGGIDPELATRIVPSLGDLDADLAVTQPIPRTQERSPFQREEDTRAEQEPVARQHAPRESSFRDALSLRLQPRQLMFLIGAALGIIVPVSTHNLSETAQPSNATPRAPRVRPSPSAVTNIVPITITASPSAGFAPNANGAPPSAEVAPNGNVAPSSAEVAPNANGASPSAEVAPNGTVAPSSAEIGANSSEASPPARAMTSASAPAVRSTSTLAAASVSLPMIPGSSSPRVNARGGLSAGERKSR